MTLEQIQERLKEIEEVEMIKEDADIKALTEEVRSLKEEKESIEKRIEDKENLKNEIAEGKAGVTIKKGIEMENKNNDNKVQFTTVEEAIRSEAYERAFAKSFVEERPVYSNEEQRALDTTNGAVLIPHQWLSEIQDQIKETHPILEDLTWQQINAIVEIPRRLTIVSGDAAVMEEGTCPVGEENEFDSIQVDLIEIQKMLEITAKMGQLLPEAFKNWLVAEVRDRIGAKLAKEAIKAIKADVLSENKLTKGDDLFADVLNLYGSVDGDGVPKVYVNRSTLYKEVYALKGEQGRDAYVANLQDGLGGDLLGTQLRVESAMADGEILIVYPQEVFFNVPGGIRVKQTEDDCFKLKISGITYMGLRLKYRKAAAVLADAAA